jgi:hypothetical protein
MLPFCKLLKNKVSHQNNWLKPKLKLRNKPLLKIQPQQHQQIKQQ